MSVMAHVDYPRAPEVEAGGLGAQSYHLVQNKFWEILCYVRPCPKKIIASKILRTTICK